MNNNFVLSYTCENRILWLSCIFYFINQFVRKKNYYIIIELNKDEENSKFILAIFPLVTSYSWYLFNSLLFFSFFSFNILFFFVRLCSFQDNKKTSRNQFEYIFLYDSRKFVMTWIVLHFSNSLFFIAVLHSIELGNVFYSFALFWNISPAVPNIVQLFNQFSS